MKSKHKITTLIVSAVVIAAVAAAVLLSGKAGAGNRDIDLSDIETMNIGAEMPKLIYSDSDTAVMHGTFGLLAVDLNTEKIIGRISYDEMSQNDISMPDVSVSKDGKRIFITDMDTGKIYKCSIQSGKISAVSEIDDKLFSTTEVNLYDKQYREYFDFNYLVGESIIQNSDSYLYLRAAADWSMKSLQLVECNSETKSEIRVIDIFE